MQATEETRLLTINTSTEVECVGFSSISTTAKGQTPEPINRDGLTVGIIILALEIASVRIEGIDMLWLYA